MKIFEGLMRRRSKEVPPEEMRALEVIKMGNILIDISEQLDKWKDKNMLFASNPTSGKSPVAVFKEAGEGMINAPRSADSFNSAAVVLISTMESFGRGPYVLQDVQSKEILRNLESYFRNFLAALEKIKTLGSESIHLAQMHHSTLAVLSAIHRRVT